MTADELDAMIAEELSILAAETGADREGDYDVEAFFERHYDAVKARLTQRWTCRRCGQNVDKSKARPCGCAESPSPWELVP